MKILRCPRCGVWPANDISIPKAVDAAGFTTVTRIVRCPGCGNMLKGDPGDGSFLGALAEWKVNYEELQEPEADAAEEGPDDAEADDAEPDDAEPDDAEADDAEADDAEDLESAPKA